MREDFAEDYLDDLRAALASLRELTQHALHVPLCGCDHEQDDSDCRIGIARSLLLRLTGKR